MDPNFDILLVPQSQHQLLYSSQHPLEWNTAAPMNHHLGKKTITSCANKERNLVCNKIKKMIDMWYSNK